MKPGTGQNAALLLLIAYSLDLVWKLTHWSELTSNVPDWGVVLALIVRFAFMGFLLYLYLRLKKSSQEPRAGMRGTMEGSLRSVLIIHRFMVGAVVLYIVAAERLAKPAQSVPLSLALSLGICALVVVVIAFGFRRKLLPPVVDALRRDPQDPEALVGWRKAQILTMILMVSVALIGVSLRTMGGSFWIGLPFFAVSLVLLLLWRPRLDIPINNEVVSSSGKN